MTIRKILKYLNCDGTYPVVKREVSLKEQNYKIGVYLLIIVIHTELLSKIILVSPNFLKIKY
jgi:hypothetical protein